MPKFKKKSSKGNGVAEALQAGPGYSHVATTASPAAMPTTPARSTAAMKKRMKKGGE